MEKHVALLTQIEAQYMLKNCAYNNASHVTFCRFGNAAYALRLTDKLARLVNLTQNPDIDTGDESVDDTIRDAINYLYMFAGDLSAWPRDPADNTNVYHTLKYIRDAAKKPYAGIVADANVFQKNWLNGTTEMLDYVPYHMFVNGATAKDYCSFAAFLITLYCDKEE